MAKKKIKKKQVKKPAKKILKKPAKKKSAKKVTKKTSNKVTKKSTKKSFKKSIKKAATKQRVKKLRKVIASKPPVKVKRVALETTPIGSVTHFYNTIKVAIVKFDKDVPVGTLVRFRGATTDFVQKIDSMQYEHAPIETAKKGVQVGIKVSSKCREGDMVHEG